MNAHEDWVTDGPVRVRFVYLGEGFGGDFDPADPEDMPLLRVDVQGTFPGFEPADDDGWSDVGSGCTLIDANAPIDRQHSLLVEMAYVLRYAVEHGGIKPTVEGLSYWRVAGGLLR